MLTKNAQRELAELNTRYSQVYARQQTIVVSSFADAPDRTLKSNGTSWQWSLLGTVLAAISALLYFLYKHAVPAGAASRWLGPLHFTIPILSPFASVVSATVFSPASWSSRTHIDARRSSTRLLSSTSSSSPCFCLPQPASRSSGSAVGAAEDIGESSPPRRCPFACTTVSDVSHFAFIHMGQD